MQTAGSEVPVSGSNSSMSLSSRSAAKKLERAPATALDCVLNVARVIKDLTQHENKCRGPSCSCAAVPRIIFHLEQQVYTESFAFGSLKLSDRLITMAAALLKGNHSARAFRRTTEFTDRLTMAAARIKCNEAQPSDSMAKHSSDDTQSSSSSGNSSSSGSSSRSWDTPVTAQQYVQFRKITARSVTDAGLLGLLQHELQQLKQDWTSGSILLTGLLNTTAWQEDPNSDHTKAQLKALRIKLSEKYALLNRSQVLYVWAKDLTDIWPHELCLTGGPAAVLTAAMQAVACHLQHMTYLARLNSLMRTHHLREVPGPSLRGVAAAVVTSKAILVSSGKSIMQPSQQQQAQQQHEQKLKQGAPQGSIPVGVSTGALDMLVDNFINMLPMCATVLTCELLQLHQLSPSSFVQLQQHQPPPPPPQQQRQQVAPLQENQQAASAGSAAEAVAFGAGGADSAATSADSTCMPASRSPHSNSSSSSVANPATDLAACKSHASGSGSGSSSAAAAAALTAEQAMLCSASELQHGVPAWLSANAPDCGVLLERAWQDFGYSSELLDAISALGATAGDATLTNTSADNSKGSIEGSSGATSSSTSGGASTDRSLYHDAKGREPASQQQIDSRIEECTAVLLAMLCPLRRQGSTAAIDFLKAMDSDGFAATHVAHLPMVLLVLSQAAMDWGSQHGLLVTVASDVFCQVFGYGCGPWRTPGDLLQQQQQVAQLQLQRSAQQAHAANWQIACLLLLLLQHSMTQAAAQQKQHQETKAAAAAAAGGAITTRAAVPGWGYTVVQWVGAVGMSLNWMANGSLHDMGLCLRISYTLQMIEAGLRCVQELPAVVRMTSVDSVTTCSGGGSSSAGGSSSSTSSSGDSSSGSSKSSKLAAGDTAVAATCASAAAGSDNALIATMRVCARLLMNASPRALKSKIILTRNPRKVVKQQQQLQQLLKGGLVIVQAALSLLLTVTKLPQVLQSAELCTYLGNSITQLLAFVGSVKSTTTPQQQLQPPLQQDQERQQQEELHKQKDESEQQQEQSQQQQAGSKGLLTSDTHQDSCEPGLLRSAPQLELQRAVLVLAGRYMLLTAAHMQQVAAKDSSECLKWLVPQLLGPDPDVTDEATLFKLLAASPLGGVVCRVVSYRMSGLLGSGCGSYSRSTSDAVAVGTQDMCGVSEQQAVQGEQRVAQGEQRAMQDAYGNACEHPMLNRLGLLQFEAAQHLTVWSGYHSKLEAQQQQIQELAEQLAAEQAKLAAEKAKSAALLAQAPRERKQLSVKDRLALKLSLSRISSCQSTAADTAEDLANFPGEPRDALAHSMHYAQALHETGALLCALLPTRFCCNNPCCSSMSTASEGFLLVRGQSCVCGGCLRGSRRPVLAPTFCTAARYCSQECQTADWKTHQHTCRLLRHAAAVTDAASAAAPDAMTAAATAAAADEDTAVTGATAADAAGECGPVAAPV